MSHARPWEESSELVVHTTYTTPNIGGTPFFTHNTVSRDLASQLVPGVRPSVFPQVTETVGVRPIARLADRPGSVVSRSHSRSPDGAVRAPRLRRPLDIAIPGPSAYISRAQSPPPAPPPSPIPMMSQYLGSDDDSPSSDTTLPPAQREQPSLQRAPRRTSIVSFPGRRRNLTPMRRGGTPSHRHPAGTTAAGY